MPENYAHKNNEAHPLRPILKSQLDKYGHLLKKCLEKNQNICLGEDTLFFLRHVCSGGILDKVQDIVTVYRYSPGSQSWRTPRSLLLLYRTKIFEEYYLNISVVVAAVVVVIAELVNYFQLRCYCY